MIALSIYGFSRDIKDGCKMNKQVSFVSTVKELVLCGLFMVVFSIPAFLLTGTTVPFVLKGFLSSIMSFGGGDAYLTVADGLFVGTELITENEFYSLLVPLVNVLPGSILCKTLSGVGYYIGLRETGGVPGGLCVALSGFSVSVAASCGVFATVAGIYDKFGTLNIFQIIKRWIRPIVSGLLINVMLSLIVQIKKLGSQFGTVYIPLGCVLFIFVMDEVLCRKFKVKNEKAAAISAITSIVFCNVFQMM